MDPASRNGRRESRLFITNLKYECYNEMEEQFERHYGVVMTKINGFSEKEATENILALSNMDKTSFESCCAGLVYAFIVDTDKEKTAKHFKLLACIAANEAQPWWTVLCVTNMILIELMHRVKTPLRSRMVTFFAHLMKDPNCKKVDSVMTNFLRFIGTDCCDITESLELLSMLIQLLLSNFDWMKQLKINSTLPTASFLNVVRYLSSPTLGKELDPYKPLFLNFVERVVRERFAWLTLLGRWVLFDLMKLSSYPSISAIWSDIYNNPAHICSDMPGGVVDMMTKTNPLVFTQRLPNLLQRRVEAIWRFPPSSDFECHFQWINETLAAPSCTGLRAELIRVMPQLAVCDKDSFYVRTVFTAFILSTAEAHEQAMCRLAFFIDWICCVREPSAQSTDLIIATLSYSSQHNPQLVNSLFDFLVLIVSSLDPPREAMLVERVTTAIRYANAKHGDNLVPILEHPNIRPSVREAFQRRFPDSGLVFSSGFRLPPPPPAPSELAQPVPQPHRPSPRDPRNHRSQRPPPAQAVPPSLPDKSIRAKTVVTPSTEPNEVNTAIDGDEDMDDMDGSLMIDTKESSSSSSEEVGILERYTAALSDDNLRELTNELDEAVRNNDGSAVEIFNKLLYAVCEKIASAEDEQLELVAHCLLVIFQPFFSKHQFVPKDTSDDSVSETLSNTPFYALFRILSLMSDEERGNHKLLVLLVQMHEKKPCLSYLMLYFLKGGRTADDGGGMNIDDDSVRLYSSFCKQREESVEDQLALDLETCETDDHRLFVYLVPYIFDKFDTHVIGSPAVLKVVCSHVDRTQLLALTCSVFRETITMFRRDSFPQLIVASLEWEPLDQLTLWRFIHSDNIPADWIFPVIPKLSSSKHPEAVANALLMLRRMSRDPTMNLIKMMFSKPAKDTFTVNALMIIFDEDDAIHRTATLLLNLVKRLTKSGSLLISKNQKGALCVELVIAHIENLRQAYLAKGTKKVETFFSHADLREMFVEIKNEHSLEQIPKKYTELFTTVEIMEDERKGRGGRKTARRRAAVTNNNGDSDSDVPAVKKKRRVKEESDSD